MLCCVFAEDSLRVDANVSVRHASSNEMGTRTEVKNIQSWKSLSKAIGMCKYNFYTCNAYTYWLDYEIKRHIDILESGEIVEQETRSFDKRKRYSIIIVFTCNLRKCRDTIVAWPHYESLCNMSCRIQIVYVHTFTLMYMYVCVCISTTLFSVQLHVFT